MEKIWQSQSILEYNFLAAEVNISKNLAILSITKHFKNHNAYSVKTSFSHKILKSETITNVEIVEEDEGKTSLKLFEKGREYPDMIADSSKLQISIEIQDDMILYDLKHIPPKGYFRIITHYAIPLQLRNGCWEFKMPQSFDHSDLIDFQVNLLLKSESVIEKYKSNWNLDYELNEKAIKCTYTSSKKLFNQKSLQFSFKTSEKIIPHIIYQSKAGEYAAMIYLPMRENITKNVQTKKNYGEYLFLVDRSGSMSGSRIKILIEALNVCLKSLDKNSRFNIISFGSSFTFLYPNSVLANTENTNDAIKMISNFTGDMGGTELYGPLNEIYKTSPGVDLPRFIFLLTDGGVSSPSTIITLIENNQNKGKIFTFGIEDADKFLVTESALKGGGKSYYINHADDIAKYAIEAIKITSSHFYDNLRISSNWEFAEKLETKTLIDCKSDIYLFGLKDNIRHKTFKITYFDSDQATDVTIKIKSNEFISGDEIFKLWAKHRIQEDTENSLGISLKYEMISPTKTYYSYNIQNPENYNSCEHAIIDQNKAFSLKDLKRKFLSFAVCILPPTCFNLANNYLEMNLSTLAGTDHDEKDFNEIIILQDSEGFWAWDDVIKAIEVNHKILHLENDFNDKQVLGTCLALAYLTTYCNKNRDTWSLIEEKSKNWLDKKNFIYQDLIEKCRQALELGDN